MNKHTFSIYLIHALVLYTVHHTVIGSIEGKPWLALIKIILVVFLTCLVSIPLTYATNKVKNYIMAKR
jgi:peptidoglycan/LPS O-acetylase OafA/YrhL